jgi:hypothetical protein
MEDQIIKIDGLSISKQSVEEVRRQIAAKVIDGEVDPVKVMASIKFYEKVFTGDDKKDNGLTHLIKSKVIDSVEKDPTRKQWFGYEVSIRETGTQYDYSKCNDDVLIALLQEEVKLKEKLKNRQDFLKTIKGHLDIITEDGEAKTIYPPAKKSTTSPVFTLK